MSAHINAFTRTPHHAEGSLYDSPGRSHKGNDSTIGSLAIVYVQYTNAIYRTDSIGDGVDGLYIASLAKVGDTLNQLRI
jgi:hypothetical protein